MQNKYSIKLTYELSLKLMQNLFNAMDMERTIYACKVHGIKHIVLCRGIIADT